MSNLKCYSLNVRGLREHKKPKSIFNHFKRLKCDILLLQETHIDSNELAARCDLEWGNKGIFSMCRAIKQGMVIVNTWVFILRRYKWHIHAGSWSLVNCWREALTRPYIRCS